MEWDKEFVGAVLRGGKDAYRMVNDRGLVPDLHLFGEGKKSWDYIVDHFRQYGEVPAVDVVRSKVDVDLNFQSDNSVEFFLDEIFERRLGHVCRDGAKRVIEELQLNQRKKAAEIWSEIHRQIQTEELTDRKVESLLSLGKEVISDYMDAKAGVRGIPTPWPSMDEQTLGWWPEDLILFVGRLGVGKTWTLVQCAHKAWQSGRKVLVVSTEMSKKQMARRFFALELRLSYGNIRRGRLGEFTEDRFIEGVNELIPQEGIKIVGGDFDYTIDNVATVIEDERPDLLCVDGPYLIRNSGKDRHERVSNTFDDFKKLGKRYGLATITNSQFNRSAKTGKEETISADNIGITDVAGWNADAAYGLLQSEEMLANWQMGIKGLKIREGKPSEFRINWNHDAMDFSEIPSDSPTTPTSSSSPPSAPGSVDSYDDMPF